MFFFLKWPQIIAAIPAPVIKALKILKAAGQQGFLVGGATRDLLLGKEATDWDIATDALPAQVEKIFPNSFPLGKKFGTILIKEDNLNIEITTFRREGAYSDKRRPDHVEFVDDIHEDLARRDFTFNAIALEPLAKNIIDPFDGRRDLARGIVRAIGNPSLRFSEDPLRMLRFYRFQAQLGFKGDKKTAAALVPDFLQKISSERVREELNRLLLSSHPHLGLQGLAESGLLITLAPELHPLSLATEILAHSIKTVQEIKPTLPLRWAAFLHDIGKPHTRIYKEGRWRFWGHEKVSATLAQEILVRLKMPKALLEKTLILIRNHMFSIDTRASDGTLRRLIRKVGTDTILDLLELRRADIIASSSRFDLAWPTYSLFVTRIKSLLEENGIFSGKDLAVDGHDVMALLAIPPGPQVGRALAAALDWVIANPHRNTKEQISNYLKEQKPFNGAGTQQKDF